MNKITMNVKMPICLKCYRNGLHTELPQVDGMAVDVAKRIKLKIESDPILRSMTKSGDGHFLLRWLIGYLIKEIQPIIDSLQRRCEAAEKKAETEYYHGYNNGLKYTYTDGCEEE